MRHVLRTTKGITLLELMAVAVIIGIVTAMAVPRFHQTFERIRFRSANRDLVSSIRMARSNAITEKDPFGVYFNTQDRSIVLFKDVVNPSLFSYDAGDSVLRVDSLPFDVNFLGTDLVGDVIVFVPNGSARFTGGGNVVCMVSTESTVGISSHNVLASTGRIQSYAHYY